MTIIDLKDFATKNLNLYSNKNLYEDLLSFNDNQFTVNLISRNYDLIKDEEIKIIVKTWDYLYAAYFGHLLFSVAEHFSCYIPDPESKDGIFFELGYPDILCLSNCLYYMMQLVKGAKGENSELRFDFFLNILCFQENFENATEYKYDSCTAVEGLWKLVQDRLQNIPHQFPDNLF